MNHSYVYGKHKGATASLFLLGDAVLLLPYGKSGKYALFGFLIALALSVPAVLIMIPVSNRFFGPSNHNKGAMRILADIGTVAGALGGFACAGLCFRRFVIFAHDILLPSAPKVVSVLIFALVVLFLLLQHRDVLLKISLVLFIVSAFIVVLFFILSVKDFKISNIAVYYFPDWKTLWKETKPFFISITLPAVLVPVIQTVLFGKAEKGICLKGFSAGMALVAFCLADALMLFGAPFATRLPYPLYSAVGTVTIGPLFTRMDGVIYYFFFSSALIKTVAALQTGILLCGKLHKHLSFQRRLNLKSDTTPPPTDSIRKD